MYSYDMLASLLDWFTFDVQVQRDHELENDEKNMSGSSDSPVRN